MQRLLNIDELSAILGVTKSTIYAWTSQNKIPHIKLGKKLLKFREDEIMAWIEKCSMDAQTNHPRGKCRKVKLDKVSPE